MKLKKKKKFLVLFSIFIIGQIFNLNSQLFSNNNANLNSTEISSNILKKDTTPEKSSYEYFLAFNWWNESWHYRVPIKIPAENFIREEPIFTFNINFTSILEKVAPSQQIDNNSLRLICYESNGDKKVWNSSASDPLKYCIPIQNYTMINYKGNPNEEQTIAVVWPWTIPADENTYAFLYFDLVSNGPKSPLDYEIGDWAITNSNEENFSIKNEKVELFRSKDSGTGYMKVGNNVNYGYVKDIIEDTKYITGFKTENKFYNPSTEYDHVVLEGQIVSDSFSIQKGVVFTEVRIHLFSSNGPFTEDINLYYRIYRNRSLVEFYIYTNNVEGFELKHEWNARYIYFPVDTYDMSYSDSHGYQNLELESYAERQYLVIYNSTNKSIGYWTQKPSDLIYLSTDSICDAYEYAAIDFMYRYFYRVGDVNETINDMQMLTVMDNIIIYDVQDDLFSVMSFSEGQIFTTRDILQIVTAVFVVDPNPTVTCRLYKPDYQYNIISLSKNQNVWENNSVKEFSNLDEEGNWTIWIKINYFNGIPKEIIKNFTIQFKIMKHPRLLFDSEDIPEINNTAHEKCELEWRLLYDSTFTILYNNDHPSLTMTSMHLDYMNYMERLAFVFLLTKDERFLHKAETYMLTVLNYSSWTSFALQLERGAYTLGIALTFDMLFDYITPENRSIIVNKLIEHGKDQYNIVSNDLESKTTDYDSNGAWFIFTPLAFLAYCLDDYYNTTPWKDEIKSRYDIVLNDTLWDDGTTHEGISYWCYGMPMVFQYALMMEKLAGINYFDLPFFKNTSWYEIYSLLPSTTRCINIGDVNPTFEFDDYLTYALINHQNNGYLKSLTKSRGDFRSPAFYTKIGKANGSIYRDTNYVHTGNYSLAINLKTTMPTYVYALSSVIEINPSKSYQFSGWYYGTESKDINPCIQFYNDTGGTSWISASGYPLTTSPSWNYFQYNINLYNPSIKSGRLTLILDNNTGNTGTIYFDDLKLIEIGESINLAPNPGFEEKGKDIEPWDFVFYPTDVEDKSLSELPLAHYFDSIGIVVQRSSWTINSSYFTFKCGPIRGGHDHPDMNSFTLTLGDIDLALDAGYTYNKSTENHNTMLFDNQGQLGEHDTWYIEQSAEHWGSISNLLLNDLFAMMTGNGQAIYDESIGLVRWNRSIFAFPGEYYFISDSVRFNTAKEYSWLLNFKGDNATNSGYYDIENGNAQMRIFPVGNHTQQAIYEDTFYYPKWLNNGTQNDASNPLLQSWAKRLRIYPSSPDTDYELMTVLAPRNIGDPLPTFTKVQEGHVLGIKIISPEIGWALTADEFGTHNYDFFTFTGTAMGKYVKESENYCFYYLQQGNFLEDTENQPREIASLNKCVNLFLQYNFDKSVSGTIDSEGDVLSNINISYPNSDFHPISICIYVDGMLLPEELYQYNYSTSVITIPFTQGIHNFVITETPINEGPVICTPLFNTTWESDRDLVVTVEINDTTKGDNNIANATLYYGYSPTYDAFFVDGVGPGGNGYGIWTFTIPAQGAGHIGQTLKFYLNATDNATSPLQPATTTNNNSNNYFAIDIIAPNKPPIIHSPIFTQTIEYNRSLVVIVEINDSTTGNHSIISAILYYGYASPYNQYSVLGVAPGTLKENGNWTFTIPAQGIVNINHTLKFFIVATDNALFPESSINNNSAEYFSVVIVDIPDDTPDDTDDNTGPQTAFLIIGIVLASFLSIFVIKSMKKKKKVQDIRNKYGF